MSESVLDTAMLYARARLEMLDESDEKRALESRLDALERSARTVSLTHASADVVVRVLSAVLALRDRIVACGEEQHRPGEASGAAESGAYEIGHARGDARPTEHGGARPRAASHVDVHRDVEVGLAPSSFHRRAVKRADPW